MSAEYIHLEIHIIYIIIIIIIHFTLMQIRITT